MKKLLKLAKCAVAKFNVYYELADCVVENATVLGMKGKYFTLCNQDQDNKIPQIHYQLARSSERVWHEFDNGDVGLVKSRHTNIFSPVDMREFMWIKLASKALYE
jgi:hypothetical protein